MMNTMRREGGRQVDTGTYDGGKLERLRLWGMLFNDTCAAVLLTASFKPFAHERQRLSSTGRWLLPWSMTAR